MGDQLDKPALRGVAADHGGSFDAALDQPVTGIEPEAGHLHRRTVARCAVGAQNLDAALRVALRK
jgi:hypothetical protein